MASLEHSDRVACCHCGQVYRTPTWGRDYLCPGCARPLAGRRHPAKPSSGRLAGGVLGAVVVLGVGVGLFRFATDRLEQNRRAALPQAEVIPPVVPPEDMETRVKQKLAILQQDLAVEPHSAYLLWRCGDLSLSLALLYRDTRPADADRWLKRAEGYSTRLDRAIPGTTAHQDLTRRIRSLSKLVWGAPSARFDSRQFRIASARFGSRPGAGGTGGWPRDLSTQPTGAGVPAFSPGAGGYPGAGPSDGTREERPSGRAELQPAPFPSAVPGSSGISARSAPVADSAMRTASDRAALPTSAASEELLKLARKESLRVNADPKTLWSLADALSAQAAVPSRRFRRFAADNPERAALAEEAIRLFLQAARLTRLRSDRATAYHDAARLYARLRRDEDACACLKRAIEAIPFAPAYWQDLRDITLRMGKTEESQRAAIKARDWVHPSPSLPL